MLSDIDVLRVERRVLDASVRDVSVFEVELRVNLVCDERSERGRGLLDMWVGGTLLWLSLRFSLPSVLTPPHLGKYGVGRFKLLRQFLALLLRRFRPHDKFLLLHMFPCER